MCGRYVSAGDLADLSVLLGANPFDVHLDARNTEKVERHRERSYNLAPTDPVPAVVPAEQPGVRQLDLLTWGLVPAWAEASTGARRINARVETVLDKPSFRRAVRSRRALLPADGWYEWVRPASDGTGPARRLPHYVSPADGGLVVFAGLYERARHQDGSSLRTCTILTGPAPQPLEWLHERAPLAVPPELWADWLDPESDAEALLDAIRSAQPDPMAVRAVPTTVNTVRNTGAQLIEPVDEEAPPALAEQLSIPLTPARPSPRR